MGELPCALQGPELPGAQRWSPRVVKRDAALKRLKEANAVNARVGYVIEDGGFSVLFPFYRQFSLYLTVSKGTEPPGGVQGTPQNA